MKTSGLWILFPALCCLPVLAQDNGGEIAQLRARLTEQQRQIEALRQAVEEQQKLIDRLAQPAAKAVAAPAVPVPKPAPETAAAPLSFDIGAAKFTPLGFVDLTEVVRSTNVGTGIGTGFAGIPFNNTAAGKLSESRLSVQNSRVGLRVDSKILGAAVTGYLETDFLGNAPGSLLVTSNSNTLRMRLFWADVRKGRWEMLAGQSWSLLTPNRKGLSPLPGDLFYSQNVDTNYQVGLIWSRDAQLRMVYHPSNAVAWGLSFESPEQYIGGAVTLPSALASAYSAQFNTGGAGTSVPNAHPDMITKVAVDGAPGGHAAHLEIAGLLRTFRSYDPITSRRFTKTGGGGSINFNVELFRNFRLIGNQFASAGGGRYIFGLGPDVVARADGSLSLVRSAATLDGFEYLYRPAGQNGKETQFYAYYGGAYYRRNYSLDAAGSSFIGYGFPGSSLGANRSIQEATFGVTQTFWKNPAWGDLKLMTQYSYLWRSPWSVPASNPQRNASSNMVFLNLRYDIP